MYGVISPSDRLAVVPRLAGVHGVARVGYVNVDGVNRLATLCAIDRVTLQPVCEFWAPGVTVVGIHELVGNALVLPGECQRTLNLRLEPIEQQGRG